MSNDHSPHQRNKGGIGPGPGPRLKAARIKAGLEIAEVASQLRLRKSVVTDLENNHYESLPASVFVQGYYRNMAEALGLPKDEIVQAYFQAINQATAEASQEPTRPLVEESKPAEAPEEKGRGFMGRLSNGLKAFGGKSGPQEDPGAVAQDLSQPRPVPKARPLPKPKTEPPQPAAPRPRIEPRVESRVEPSLEMEDGADSAQESDTQPGFRPEPRLEPTTESRPSARPRPARQATAVEARDTDLAETPRSFRPRGRDATPGFSLPKVSFSRWLPKNPAVLVRRTFFFTAIVAVIALVLWGISQIPMRGLVDDMMRKWSALIDSPQQQTQAIPPQLGEPEPFSTPLEPSADTQLLEPPPLSDSLLDFEPPGLTASPEVADEPSEPAPTAGPHKIIVELKGVSWVEIEDATKEYRLVGELQKGSVHELKGSPPYKVLFGRGNLVKLTVDGKDYDFSKYQQGSVARFTLNP